MNTIRTLSYPPKQFYTTRWEKFLDRNFKHGHWVELLKGVAAFALMGILIFLFMLMAAKL